MFHCKLESEVEFLISLTENPSLFYQHPSSLLFVSYIFESPKVFVHLLRKRKPSNERFRSIG